MLPRSALAALLSPFDVGTLDAKRATICGLDDALRIVYVNPAWDAFARDNGARWEPGAWGVGAAYLDPISPELRPFYEDLFARARTSPSPVAHEYDCSTPERERRFQLRVTRCASGVLLAVHSLVFDAPHDGGRMALESRYRGESGFVVMCAHCRRTRRADSAGAPLESGEWEWEWEWEWVPEFAAQSPVSTSHGLCYTCLEAHFPP